MVSSWQETQTQTVQTGRGLQITHAMLTGVPNHSANAGASAEKWYPSVETCASPQTQRVSTRPAVIR